MNKPLNDLEPPDGVTETTAPVADSSQKAEDTGSSAGINKESEPAPHSSDSLLGMDDNIDEAFRKVKVIEHIEPLLNGLYDRTNSIITIGHDIKQIAGSTVARYLVTDQQVKRFEADLIRYFGDLLTEKQKKEYRKFCFDIEYARKAEVDKFDSELKNGWWFSNKVGWFLYMSNIITFVLAAIYCYYK